MRLTERLYKSVEDIWMGYLEQPFVKELAEDTLDVEKFRFYMIQDYRYLLQYAKVFAFGVIKTEDPELMRRFAGMVHDVLDGEMNVHKTYMARLGITEEEVANTPSALTNQSYTSYMLDVANKGGPLEILMELSGHWRTPCEGAWRCGTSSLRRMGTGLQQQGICGQHQRNH